MPEAELGSIYADLGLTCSPKFLSKLARITQESDIVDMR